MRHSKNFLLFITVAVLFPANFASAGSSVKKFESDSRQVPIQIHGDSVEYFHEEQKTVGVGHVSIDYEDVKLTADKITVYMAAKEASAEGHVVLTQKGSVFMGDRADFNFATKVGKVSKMSATMEPGLYGKAERIEKISDKQYRATDSYVTTCCGDDPFYKIKAHQIDFFPDDKVVIRNAILMVRGVPVLFIPYYVQPFIEMDRFPVQIVPGRNSKWGTFVLTKWRYHLATGPDFESKGNVLLDYRSKRGVGAGVENFYRGDKIGRGAARVYAIQDSDAPPQVDGERTRVQWRHQAKVGEATTLTTEINQLSDADVIKDFFYREEYARDAFPDNYISLITSKPEYTFSVLERNRLDALFSVVERSPEVRFDTTNHEFQDTPFYFRQEVQFSNLIKSSAASDEGIDATRLDTNHTLSCAGRVGDVSVTPRIGTRQTFYSRDTSGDGRDFVRGAIDPGLDVSTRFYKVYDAYVKTFGLDYNQIRHIFEPTVSYNYRPDPTVLRTSLQQFDALDTLDKQNFIRFNFENKLQTKEHAKDGTPVTREIARAIPFLDTDLHTGRLTNTGMKVELRPYAWLGIEGDAAMDPETRHPDTADLDFYMQKNNVRLALGQRYVRDESGQTTAEVHWQMRPDMGVKVYERFEFETNVSKEFEVTLSKTFSCIIVDVTYNHQEMHGNTFYFEFRLKSFPKSSFGLHQTYDSPRASSRGL